MIGRILLMGLMLAAQTAIAAAAASEGPHGRDIRHNDQRTERRLAQAQLEAPTVTGTITIIYEKPEEPPQIVSKPPAAKPCPEGMVRFGVDCVRIAGSMPKPESNPPASTCNNGYMRNGVCVSGDRVGYVPPQATAPPPSCDRGFVRQRGRCVRVVREVKCDKGYVKEGGRCVQKRNKDLDSVIGTALILGAAFCMKYPEKCGKKP